MRKAALCMMTAVLLSVSVFSGCQKAPEVSDDGNIPHAQSALEQQVAEIAGGNTEEKQPPQSGGVYEGTIGTTDNKMRISALIPAVPENVYQMTLVPDEGLDMDALIALLDSGNGNIEDTSQELLDEIAQSDYNNIHGDNGESFYYSRFGDHSAMRITDGEKEAFLTGHTSAGYADNGLKDTCYENIYTSSKDAAASTVVPVDQPDTGTDFTVKEAEQLLRDKLVSFGITEIALSRIVYIEGNGYCYYDLEFVPAYEGTALTSETVYQEFGEIFPMGFASVAPEGVMELGLDSFCGRVADREPVTVLTFEQVVKILEQYLDSNMIHGDERITINNIKLEYYSVPNPSPREGELEYRSELKLIPVWHLYMPLDDYVEMLGDQGGGLEGALYNIWINAVTGEIERVV